MKIHGKRPPGVQARQGIALVYALFGAMMAAGMVSVMFATAGNTSRNEDLRQDKVRARYLAEGGAEVARKGLAQSVANWQTPPAQGQLDVAGNLVTYTVQPIGATRTMIDKSGIQTLVDTYEVTAQADVDGRLVQVHHMVSTESTPVFQFAVFYTDDLEINPGPDMTLGGRVHSNGDMYLGCDGTLTMDTNYVHAVGNIYRSRKDTGDPSGGSVRIRQWVEDPYDPSEPISFQMMQSYAQMMALGIGSHSGYDSGFSEGFDADGDGRLDGPDDWLPFAIGALQLWGEPEGYMTGSGHTVLTGQHDLLEASAPDIGSIAMFEPQDAGDYVLNGTTGEYDFVGVGAGTHSKGYFHEHAGLSIVVSEDGSDFEAWGPGGAENSPLGTSYKQLLLNSGAVSLTGVADMRQSNSSNEDTPVVQIDLALLGDAGLFPENGLLYAAHYGMGEGTDAKGLLLKGGAELADRLTVACEGAVYVQGDYNTGDKKGAAIIGDSVNLLSNAWDGSKTAGSLPSASETTYNCAFITGNYESEVGRYNGGLENLPRFHENWSGVPCHIKGSFVNTWDSQFGTGSWVYGSDRYTAPDRLWAYDEDFNSVANLPPFTPMVVGSRQIVTW
ncbi:MAG: hypothetical protein H6830_01295 [Planctomycetes bacterium]|nr:hypothetical protein [Planctomycetota bacterium]MCB9910897.1 hypothetical protein [Planctomycetota bacterium]MCB9912108.1 hypothetical protein [Planctomycetota bacterium]